MQPVNILFQRLHPSAVLPTKGHSTDACFDLVAVAVDNVSHDAYIEYSLGFATAIPDGWQALIYPRSSISKYDLALCNSVAVIDAGYRGEWKVRFRRTSSPVLHPPGGWIPNASMKEQPRILPGACHVYGRGNTVAQVQFQRVPEATFEVVESLPASSRGAGGFGSTGA